MGALPSGCNAHIHHPGMVHPVQAYPHQPLPVLPGNHGVVGHSDGFVAVNPQWKYGNKLCGRQDANFAAFSPCCSCKHHTQTPSPPAYHVQIYENKHSIKPTSGYLDMHSFQLLPSPTPWPSPVLPAGADSYLSKNTVESSLVTVVPREAFVPSTLDSLDNVSSIPVDDSCLSSAITSLDILPEPSPFLAYDPQKPSYAG